MNDSDINTINENQATHIVEHDGTMYGWGLSYKDAYKMAVDEWATQHGLDARIPNFIIKNIDY